MLKCKCKNMASAERRCFMTSNQLDFSTVVSDLLSKSTEPLPAGSFTFTGSFCDQAISYIAAKRLDIQVGLASGYSFVYSLEDYETVIDHIRKNYLIYQEYRM